MGGVGDGVSSDAAGQQPAEGMWRPLQRGRGGGNDEERSNRATGTGRELSTEQSVEPLTGWVDSSTQESWEKRTSCVGSLGCHALCHGHNLLLSPDYRQLRFQPNSEPNSYSSPFGQITHDPSRSESSSPGTS